MSNAISKGQSIFYSYLYVRTMRVQYPKDKLVESVRIARPKDLDQ